MQFHFFCPKHKHNYNSFIQTGIVIISSLHSLLGHHHINESLSTDIGMVSQRATTISPGWPVSRVAACLLLTVISAFLPRSPHCGPACGWTQPRPALLVISWHRDSNGPAITHHTSHQHTAAVLSFIFIFWWPRPSLTTKLWIITILWN